MTADEIIAALGLERHPEGGWFRETWRAEAARGQRPSGTMIYFLLAAGERSHWHRVDAAEHWLWHAGAPLSLRISETAAGPAALHRLGPELPSGQLPQILVPPHHWQSAETAGDWTLVSCAVSPGFDFAGFELAAPGFDIPG
ncbi:cupin domain-containing protein [Mangrovicoccus sp. HB161399]|uniref:cupin domain-containing protein n=1 Tax=Mangrovicoccus sp. HB161399 TaxID=2720392 RepID=UPI0015540417|nr:cupin domain-containing protein [Mangrovicoccus sp. HB161399]